MKNEARETLSAFADGESVATPDLLDALTQPGAHQALIDFLRLRDAMEDPRTQPRPEFVARMRSVLEPRRVPWWRQVVAVPAPLAVALAVLILATLVLVAELRPRGGASPDAPPAPSRILHFQEGVDWTRNPPSPGE